MAKFIRSNNISKVWLRALAALENEAGTTTNLIICLIPPFIESTAITAALDTFLQVNPKAFSIEKIAGTIFPREFYIPDRLGAAAQEHLYKNHRLARIIESRWSRKGNYFDRMVSWPARDGSEINQLEKKISYYREELGRDKRTCNVFEIATNSPNLISNTLDDADIQIYDPEQDCSIMSFPCLSHISVSLSKSKLHMTAIYRNQYFLQKAYGNYLGLLRLLSFLAREIDVEVGELVCVATHANDEVGSNGFKRSEVKQLLDDCARLLPMTPPMPVQTTYIRPVIS